MGNEAIKTYRELMGEAETQVRSHASADQVIVVKTAKSNTYCFANPAKSGVYDEEDRFVQMLSVRGDSQIQYIVCMWNSCEIDIPSMNFRKRLLAACPKNAEAGIILRTAEKLIVKTLSQCM